MFCLKDDSPTAVMYMCSNESGIGLTYMCIIFFVCRDLQDVGASKIKVYSLNKVFCLLQSSLHMQQIVSVFLFQFLYGKISGKRNGRVRKGVIFTTYSSLIGESSRGGKYRTRLNQLLHWLGSQFDGVVSFPPSGEVK